MQSGGGSGDSAEKSTGKPGKEGGRDMRVEVISALHVRQRANGRREDEGKSE